MPPDGEQVRSLQSATPGVTIRIVNQIGPTSAPTALSAPAIDVTPIEDELTRDVNGNPIFRPRSI
jgi:hypothetical protein